LPKISITATDKQRATEATQTNLVPKLHTYDFEDPYEVDAESSTQQPMVIREENIKTVSFSGLKNNSQIADNTKKPAEK